MSLKHLKSNVRHDRSLLGPKRFFHSAANNPPELFGNDTFRAKIFVESVYRFTATDVGDNFTVVIERSPAIGEKDFTLERDGSQFSLRWTPRGVGSVSFTVIANDSRGAVSELQPLVRLCGCALQNGAECIELDTDGGEDGFILEDCECGPGMLQSHICAVYR